MCTYHLCFTGQIKFLNYNKIPQQGESIGNEASPKPHAGTASSSGGTIEESLVSLTLVDLATVRDTVKLKDLLLSSLVNLRSPLVHIAGNNSPLVHVLGSPLVHFFFYLDPSRALRKTFFFRTNIHVPSVVPMQFLHRSVIAPMRRPLNSRRSLRSRTSKTDPLRIDHKPSC